MEDLDNNTNLIETEGELVTLSSGEYIKTDEDIALITERINAALSDDEPAAEPIGAERSDAFKELALPKLPELKRENRARLQMQTPNRVYFYWSMKNNPFQVLSKVFGDDRGSYTLVLKLINTSRKTEEIHAVDAEGNYWFNVDPDSSYRAEIGFYAPNRPYFRALYSNTLTTPRKSPSPRVATEADWNIPAQKFAKVLDASGFKQDAFDVAIAGDDVERAETASYSALSQVTGRPASELSAFDSDDIRYALTLLAAGAAIEELRFRISDRLFTMLSSVIGSITRENAIGALRSEFEIDEDELFEEYEEFGPAVFGASLVNFPKRVRTRPRGFDRLDKLAPLASHSLTAR
jgi:hypothetical protein